MLTLINSDCLSALRDLPAESVQCCVTSPPYFGLRDYGQAGQIGLEPSPAEYVAKMGEVFEEVRRVLKEDGTLWLNLGDSYANDSKWGGSSSGKHVEALHGATGIGRGKKTTGLKPKDLIGIPWRVAFALQSAGWWLREDIIWAKPNCMPESVLDRCTRSHEYIFHFAKSERYYHDGEAIKEPCALDTAPRYERGRSDDHKYADGGTNGQTIARTLKHMADKQRGHSRKHAGFNERWDAMEREEQCTGMRNKRSVWTVAPASYPDAHFATFPETLITPCVLAGSRCGDVILDPFGGSGTTGKVAIENGRRALLIELNPDYCALIRQRCAVTVGLPLP